MTYMGRNTILWTHPRWNYPEGYVNISMPGYVKKALKKFNHKPPKRPENAPHNYTAPIYGQRTQQRATQASTIPLLPPDRKQSIQAIVGTFLYYGLGIDSTILVTLNEISGQQSTATTDTETKCAKLMDYLHTHPNTVVQFHASNMILYIESDAAYLVLPKSRSRVASIFYLSNATAERPPLNGAIQVICKTLQNVVSSADKAETGGIFVGGQQAVPIITVLSEINHRQPASGIRISTDNSAAKGVLTANLHQKLSKAFNMRYWWIK